MAMKKLLLSGIAALLMATSAAHADGRLRWQCGNVGVTVTPVKDDNDDRNRWSFDTEPVTTM